MSKGKLIMLVGCSGAGKDSVLLEAQKTDDNYHKLVTYTTRQPRQGEEDGKHYHFVSRGQIFWLAQMGSTPKPYDVHGNFYTYSYKDIDQHIENGHNIVFIINYQGAVDLKERYPNAPLVYIAPPNLEVLRNRLSQRGTETSETMERRMTDARIELDRIGNSDYVDHIIFNHDLYESGKEFMDYVDHL